MRIAPIGEKAIQRFTVWLSSYACAAVCLVSLLPSLGFAQAANDVAPAEKPVVAPEVGLGEARKESAANIPSNHVSTGLYLSAKDMPSRGSTTAKIVLVEYFDYECPYCAAFFDETMPQLLTEYIATGKLRFVARDFPLEADHPLALRVSMAARCANEQGKFWPMHDELLGNSDALDRKSLSVYGQEVQLDVPAFDKCLDSDKYAADIKVSEQEGSKLGIIGTPTFFLGIVGSDGKTLDYVQRFIGTVEYAKLKTAIDRFIAKEEKTADGYRVGYK